MWLWLTASYFVALYAHQIAQKLEAYDQARAYADSGGKPLLTIGCPRTRIFPSHPCGDVCIDIEELWGCGCENLIIADIRDIPYPDKHFGAALASHVLEHLKTVADAEQALQELHRVAEEVWIVNPHRLDIVAWLHPDHHLWVTEKEGEIIFEQR